VLDAFSQVCGEKLGTKKAAFLPLDQKNSLQCGLKRLVPSTKKIMYFTSEH
jgi:hypothetical protein